MKDKELQDELWSIVRAVATTNANSYIEVYGNKCPYCASKPMPGVAVKHKDDCVVLRARKLVEEATNEHV